MKKGKSRKLNFSSLSVIELNAKQMTKVVGGADEDPTSSTDTCRTQTGPPDKFSNKCQR